MTNSHDVNDLRLWLARLLSVRLPSVAMRQVLWTRMAALETSSDPDFGQVEFPGLGTGAWEARDGEIISVSVVIVSGATEIDRLVNELMMNPISDWGSASSLVADGLVIHTWTRASHLVDLVLLADRPMLVLRVHDRNRYPQTLAHSPLD